LWKVLFPIDDCHTVKFKSSGTNDGEVSLAKHGLATIKTAGKTGSKFEIGDNYTDFFDLTAGYSHKNGIKMRAGWQDKAVLLTIENAKFSVKERTHSRFQLKKAGKVVKDLNHIGYSGKAEIEGEEIIVEVEGLDGFPKSFTEDCTLTFDNDCPAGNHRDTTDLVMLYEIIEDKIDAAERFTIERDPRDKAPKPAAGHSVKSKPTSINDTNVPAREPGLPCHKVQVSQPDELP